VSTTGAAGSSAIGPVSRRPGSTRQSVCGQRGRTHARVCCGRLGKAAVTRVVIACCGTESWGMAAVDRRHAREARRAVRGRHSRSAAVDVRTRHALRHRLGRQRRPLVRRSTARCCSAARRLRAGICPRWAHAADTVCRGAWVESPQCGAGQTVVRRYSTETRKYRYDGGPVDIGTKVRAEQVEVRYRDGRVVADPGEWRNSIRWTLATCGPDGRLR
jgi:hypothetical protein